MAKSDLLYHKGILVKKQRGKIAPYALLKAGRLATKDWNS